MPVKVALLVFTYNEAKEIGDFLSHIYNKVDKIYLIDSYSGDRTVDIARQYGAKIFYARRLGYQDPLRPLGLMLCGDSWIVNIDVDERLPSCLLVKLRDFIDYADNNGYVAISLPYIEIRNKHFFAWIRDKVKIFNGRYVKFKGNIHELPVVNGRILSLNYPYAIIHCHSNSNRFKHEIKYFYLIKYSVPPTIKNLHLFPGKSIFNMIPNSLLPRFTLCILILYYPIYIFLRNLTRYRYRYSFSAVIYYTLIKTLYLLAHITRGKNSLKIAESVDKYGLSNILSRKISIVE